MRWLALFLLLACAARAEEAVPIRYGYSGGADTVAAWIAADRGMFQARGLAVTLTQVANSALFPAALQSGSLDIAAPTAPLVLQADAGGLDLVIVSGGSVALPSATGMVALGRAGLDLGSPAAFAGRKVAVPGLGGFLDLIFRDWLARGGVAADSVHYVELGQGAMADALRSGNADAVVVSDPMATRIRQTSAGVTAAFIMRGMPEGVPVIVYAATRDWAQAHEAAARGFASAIAEASDYADAHPEEARATIAKYLKVAPELARDASLPTLRPAVTARALEVWLPIMRGQGVLSGAVDTGRLVWQ